MVAGQRPLTRAPIVVCGQTCPALAKEALFDYRPSRSRDSPNEMLLNFKGHLQVDGYNGYDETGRLKNVNLLDCVAHPSGQPGRTGARRYFEKALPGDKKRAPWMLEQMRLLYMIERFAGSHNDAGRAAILYILISTAKRHGHDPYEYLKDVINRIADHPHNWLEELLPANWLK